MKILIFSSLAVVGLLLVGLQHQQLRDLRAENTSLQQSSAEANQLKADLANSTGDEAQDEAEIARLREENRGLLKLRNEVNQLRGVRVQFEKVSAENQRLQSLAKTAAKTDSKQSMQPITIRIDNLTNRGLISPEDAVQTFYWALRERNNGVLTSCVTAEMRPILPVYTNERERYFDSFGSIEIVARREMNATTVQLGIQLDPTNNSQSPQKFIVELVLQGNEWRVKTAGYF